MTAPVGKLIKPRCSYLICTSPRSGSWLLSDALEATGLAGRPREWFHRNAEIERCQGWNIPLPTKTGYAPYLSRVIRVATTPNGVFGVKCHWYQFELLPGKLATVEGLQGMPLAEALGKLFPNPKFIWLTRRNKIRQAISLHRARQTGTWWHEESFAKKLPPRRAAQFDPRLIDNAERHLLSNEMGWQNFFRASNVQPFRIIYEDFVGHYEETVRDVLEFLEIPQARQVEIVPPRVKSQSDGTTEDWMKQYVEFKRNRRASKANEPTAAAVTVPVLSADSYESKSDSVVRFSPTTTQSESSDVDPPRSSRRGADAGLGGAAKPQGDDKRRRPWLERMLEAYSDLVRLDPDRTKIERRHGLSAADFLKHFYAGNRPVILTDLQHDYGAIAHITPEYIKVKLAERMIDLSARQKRPTQVSAEAAGESISFPRFIDEQILSPASSRKVCFTAPYRFFRFHDGSALLEGFTIFPEFLDQQRTPDESFLGIEPAGFVSPLRNEPANAMVVQLYGRKTIRLIPWYEFGNLNALMEKTPKAKHLEDANRGTDVTDSAIEVTLAPGEALFVPLGWWHSERAHDVNITLALTNFVFPNRFNKRLI
jgi:LPS sulfotransferase NodH